MPLPHAAIVRGHGSAALAGAVLRPRLIETTGGVAADLGITEIGAIRYLGSESQATFHPLVNPELPNTLHHHHDRDHPQHARRRPRVDLKRFRPSSNSSAMR